jgi:hypothetical protein
MAPDESHAANTPTNGQVARVGEGDVARKRLLPSLENLRRPVPFFPARISVMLGRYKVGSSRAALPGI